MQLIDWILLAVPILVVIGVAAYTRHFMRSVADFMAGGRAAGRYLICNAKGEASSGVANTLAKFQPLIAAGFVLSWWDALSLPIIMLFAMFGFVVYRYRQTRAMTLGQFFEMRYSRRFRLVGGMFGFIAGILNYGIFPAVSSEFFVYFLNLPQHVSIGPLLVPTKILIMIGYLSCALWMMTVGGQVTLLVTHCVEGILSHAIFVVIVAAIFWTISWTQMRTALLNVPPGHSMVNPFDQTKTKDFNVWFSLIYLVMSVYGTMTAQKDNSFSSAGRTAHETRMGGLLGWWRIMARASMLLVVGLGAFTLLKQPDFAGHSAISAITDPQLRSQMTVPIALRYLLPAGVKGLFCTMMVLGLISGDASHILTWGGIFVQDVVLPLRTQPLSPAQHVFYLRLALVGVALFALLFSIFFHQIQDIVMWWAETEGIFACWAGIVIIGGLYWKKGTAPAAWAAFLTGVTLDLIGIVIPYFRSDFPYNGRQVQFFSAAAAVVAYVIISLFTFQQDFNLDQLLHRGRYAIKQDLTPETRHKHHRFSLARLLGFDDDYTFWDKLVAGAIFVWSMFWLAVVLVGTAWNFIHPWPINVWTSYWFIAGLILPLLVCLVTLIWFGIGGVLDLRSFFNRLSSMKRDASDDGTVTEPAPQGFTVLPASEKTS